eukprot:415395_1
MLDTETMETNKTKSQHSIAQKYRSESALKWWVLFDIFCSWSSAYFLTYGVSSLETTLLTIFQWESAQFSYLVAATFLGAVIGPAMIPLFDAYSFKLCTLLNNQVILFLGELMFSISLYLYSSLLSYSNIRIQYVYILILFSRFVIGIAMGSTDSLAQSSINYWFGQSKYNSQAFGLLIIGIEIGIISSRYLLPAIYEYFNHISIPFFVSLLPSVFAIMLNNIVKVKIIKSHKTNPEWYYTEYNDTEIVTNSIWNQFRQLSFKIWCIIWLVIIANVVINTVYSCYVDPLHKSFNMSEYQADQLLSVCAVVVIVLGFPIGWCTDYIGGQLYVALYVTITMMVSSGILTYFAIFEQYNADIYIYGVTGIAIFSIALPFVSVIFAIQAMESPPELGSLIASISTTLWWVLSIFTANAIGWIYDSIHNYGYSILVVFVLCCIQFIIALVLIFLDKRHNGFLTKCCI